MPNGAKRWLFTDNTTTETTRRNITEWEIWNSNNKFEQKVGKGTRTKTKPINKILKFIIVGLETGPETGILHGQGYLELQKQTSLAGVKSILGLPTVHLTVARGTAEDNIAYCTKDAKEGEVFTYGKEGAGQGHRTDLDKTVALIAEGATPMEIAEQCPKVYMKYHGGIDKMVAFKLLETVPLVSDIKIWMLWGGTGTGKTWSALFTNVDEDQVYLKHACDLKKDWWQGYKGQSRVVIDEFYNGCAHITTFLKLLDKYRKELEIKNSITYSRWTELIITTNLQYPAGIYSGASEEHRCALFRRIRDSGGGAIQYTEKWGQPGWVDKLAEAQDLEPEEPEAVEAEPRNPNIDHGFVFDD